MEIKFCKNCNSEDLIKIRDSKPLNYANSLGVGPMDFKTVNVEYYCCYNCGYLEAWIPKVEDRDRLKEYYKIYEERHA